MARKTIKPVAPLATLSPREKFHQLYARWEPDTTRELNRIVKRAEEAREELLAKIAKSGPGGLAYEIAWGESAVQSDYESWIAAGILDHMQTGDAQPTPRERLYAACKHYRGELTRRLLSDCYRQSGTGYFHRAAEGAERASASRMREKLDWYVTRYEEAEELGAKLAAESSLTA